MTRALRHLVTAGVRWKCLQSSARCLMMREVSLFGCKAHSSRLFSSSIDEEYNWDPKQDEQFKKSFEKEERAKAASDDEVVLKHKILSRALTHVVELGWTDAALAEGARDAGLSPAVVSIFQPSPNPMLQFFLQDINTQLEQFMQALRQQHMQDFERIRINDFVFESCKHLFTLIEPYKKVWPSALAITVEPANVIFALSTHADLVNNIWHFAGDTSIDYNWYTKRSLLSTVISSTQLFWLQDKSEDHIDTWAFLKNRLADVGMVGKGIADARKAVYFASSSVSALVETARNLAGVPTTNRPY